MKKYRIIGQGWRVYDAANVLVLTNGNRQQMADLFIGGRFLSRRVEWLSYDRLVKLNHFPLHCNNFGGAYYLFITRCNKATFILFSFPIELMKKLIAREDCVFELWILISQFMCFNYKTQPHSYWRL